jgi:hypothetical protein
MNEVFAKIKTTDEILAALPPLERRAAQPAAR